MDVGITSVLRRYLVGALICIGSVAVLTGCEPIAPSPEVSAKPSRNPAVNIGATTRFDPVRFSGDWHVVARFNETGEIPARETIAVTYNPKTLRIVMLGAEGPQIFAYSGSAVLRPKKGEPLVVMWVDEGFRTAVLGTPSGKVGYVLDRKPKPSADRFKAATEILTFYGWDISRLQRIR
jgi:apolipoprotein D and lipocalin family protein